MYFGMNWKTVTKHCNRLGLTFAWQRRFFNVIIWAETDYHTIVDYIRCNPKNWKEDEFNASNPLHSDQLFEQF